MAMPRSFLVAKMPRQPAGPMGSSPTMAGAPHGDDQGGERRDPDRLPDERDDFLEVVSRGQVPGPQRSRHQRGGSAQGYVGIVGPGTGNRSWRS
jgi:hypothetical protein